MRLIRVVVVWLCCTTVFAQQVEFTSSNLPIVIIDTNGGEIVDDPKIVVDMRIIDNGPDERNNITDEPNVYNGKAAIEIRGSSSQMFEPGRYSTKFTLGVSPGLYVYRVTHNDGNAITGKISKK